MRPADGVTRAGVAHLGLPLGDRMSALVGPGTWIDGVYVVDAAARSVRLDELITHDDVADGNGGIGRCVNAVRCKMNGVLCFGGGKV